MKQLWLDPVGGASGDMILGALLDVGVPLEELRAALKGLSVGGFRLECHPEGRMGIFGTRLRVRLDPDLQPHRHLLHIEQILQDSRLSPAVRESALRVFRTLAQAEAHVHQQPLEQVHFHEVGAVDALVDVVGVAWALEWLGVDGFLHGRPPLGRGFVEAAHGRIPLPAPATLEILKGIPIDMVETEGETVTPTGAALLRALGRPGLLPAGAVVERIGYGVGGREFPDRPNLVRAVLARAGAPSGALPGDIVVITASVDDMNPQHLPFLMDRLFEAGALDVAVTPVVMKKGRSGHQVTALAPPAAETVVCEALLTHSTTLGLRTHREARLELRRALEEVTTPWGPVRVKVTSVFGRRRVVPEFEDCAQLAREHGLSVREVTEAAQRLASDPPP